MERGLIDWKSAFSYFSSSSCACSIRALLGDKQASKKKKKRKVGNFLGTESGKTG
jgi:hypothetical protein